MPASTIEPNGLPTAARVLTVPYLAWFTAPLMLTFLMMSGAAPLVSNGITWIQGAAGERVHLPAFLMTFATALLVYSPMFTARNVAIRTIRDRRSMRAFAVFFLFWAMLSAVLLVLISQVDAVGHLVFGTGLGAPTEVEQLARRGLLVFTPLPILVALRGLGQGVHITNGQTWYVGFGTVLRFIAMAVFVFGYAIHHGLSGPVLGGFTYLTGIGVETVFVLVTLLGKPQWGVVAGEPVLTFGRYLRYAGPLMLGSGLQQLSTPILIYMINHAGRPGENGAAFNLIRDTAWILVSMLMSIQATVIAHASSRANMRVILRFSLALGGTMTAIAALLALTPARHAIFVDWLRVDNQAILALTFTCLLWLLPLPAISMTHHFIMALHTRSGRTGWVTAGSIAGLAGLIIAAWLLNLPAHQGAILAIIGHGSFQLVSMLVQAVGLRGDGLWAAMDDRAFAHRTSGRAIIRDPLHDQQANTTPLPEQVRV